MTGSSKQISRDLPSFASELRALVGEGNRIPPVQSWQPEVEGEIDIRIDKNGVWFYQEEEMARASVVKLLSSILRKDGHEYFLVSPVEKMKLQVEDVPFVVTMMDVEGEGEGQKVHFSTSVGDYFTLSELHPMRVTYNDKGQPSPYVRVRHDLDAKIVRAVYYEMAERLVELSGDDKSAEAQFGLWSDGKLFQF
jgi:hypothetical protein